jgi:hypothetical protein
VAQPRTIVVGGWVAFMVYAFPGYMGWDSVTQLAQARRGYFTDDHPPALAVLWRFFEHFVHGPLLMLVAVSIPFAWGLFAILRRYMQPKTAAWASVLVLWFPPILTIMAAIFKDTLMAACLVAGTAMLLAPRRSWIGLVLMGAATLFRYNAIAATFPLVVLLWRYGTSAGWRRYAIAAAAWFGVTAAALEAPRVLADEETHYWYWSHALMDMSGTLEFSRPYSDAELEALLPDMLHVHDHIQDRMRAIYQPVDFRHLDRGEHQIFEHPITEAQRQTVGRAWKTLIHDNAAAYLSFRWQNFSALNRFDHAVYMNAATQFGAYGHEDNELVQQDAAHSKIQRRVADVMIAISYTKLFDPAPYLILGLLLIPFALRERLAGALIASGLAYQLAWFVLAPTADYRYSHWLVTTITLATIVLFASRYRRQASVR